MRAHLSILLLASVGLAACGGDNVDSLVVVHVTADASLDGVAAFTVEAEATTAGKSSTFRVTAPGGAATFDVDGAGQSFGIDLPKTLTGALHVHVDAVDGTGATLAGGDGDTTIKRGARVDLPLTLMVVGATADLGADGGDDGGGDMGTTSGGGPVLTIDRTSQNFGSFTVGQSSQALSIDVTNSGMQPTSALTFTPSGADLDQFSLNSDCGAVLLPNGKCHVSVAFEPTSTGDKHARFVVAADMGGTVAVDLSGTGTPPGTLSITADAATNGDCGAALVGATSGTMATYTVKNVGTSATGAPAVSTSDATQFVASGCASALQPNDTCTVTVQFTAKHHGQQTASVSVTAAPGGTANASVSGFGQNPASFSITSTSGFDFGSAAVGSNGSVLTLTATNVGDVASPALVATNVTGANPSSFAIVSDGCNTATVAAGASCNIGVRFSPQAEGPLSATVNVRGASTLGSASVSGMGTAPGTLAISADPPANGDCGAALIGATSATTATYTVKNIGTSATGAPTVSTSDATQFVATGCAAALQPNATCTVTVTFTAKHHGTQTASVSASATPGGTANASVTGFGQNPASFTLSSTSGFDFGSAATGTNGSTLTFTATNGGDVTSPALIATNLTGANPTSFTITSDGCNGAAVAAQATCSINVRFNPQAQGPLSATLSVRSSSATLGSASLSGTGTAPGTLAISADSPANGNCGSAVIGSTSTTTATYTVKNVGTSATGMPTVSTSDAQQFIASGCAVASLAPNATCTVSVQFKAKKAGTQMASVSATASPGGTASASVTGVGLNPAAFSLAASTFDFGSVQRTIASTTITVTATNTGDVASPTLGTTAFNGDGSFTVPSDGCTGKVVQPGGTCTFTTQLTPKTTGPQSATVSVMSGSTALGSHTMTGTGTPIWVRELSYNGLSGSLRSVWGAGGHVWAVGDNQAIFTRSSSGTWTAQTTSFSTAPSYTWITGSGPTDLWAMDANGFYRSQGDGTWIPDVFSSGTTMGGIFVLAPNDVWYTSTTDSGVGTTYMETTTAWRYNQATATSETASQGCRALWGTSDSDLFCAYNAKNCPGSCVHFWGIAHRDATGTWSDMYQVGTSTIKSPILTIWGTSSSNVYYGDNLGRPVHYDGSSWAAVDPSAPTGALGIWGSSASDVYFVGPYGIVEGNGSTWGTPYQPNSLSAVGVWGTGANDVYVVGSDSNGMCIYHWF